MIISHRKTKCTKWRQKKKKKKKKEKKTRPKFTNGFQTEQGCLALVHCCTMAQVWSLGSKVRGKAEMLSWKCTLLCAWYFAYERHYLDKWLEAYFCEIPLEKSGLKPYDTEWGPFALRHGITNSMEAILACHPALSRLWPDRVAKWCEWWRMRTNSIA